METVLNIALLLVGTAATLSAFGGEAWRKGNRPILERVTSRGWISLLCLALALILGVVKEFYTKGQEEAGKTREQQLQSKVDDEGLRLAALQKKADEAGTQLTNTTTALAKNEKIVTGITTVEEQIDGQVSAGNKQIDIANQNLQKSAQVLDELGNLQTEIKNISAAGALAQAQDGLEVDVFLPIKWDQKASIIDAVFPSWKEDGSQGTDDALVSIDLSAERRIEQEISASLLIRRGRTYKIEAEAYIFGDPALESPPIFTGDMGITGEGDQTDFEMVFSFHKQIILGEWTKVFMKKTRVITMTLAMRSDISPPELKAQVDSCNRIFPEKARMRIPMTNQGGYFMEYGLTRIDAVSSTEGSIPTVSIIYFISSSPSFHSDFLETQPH